MSTTEKNLEKQVQLWSMPGPAAILLTLLVITATAPSRGLTFPLIAVAGFSASWFWKIRGAAASLIILILCAFLSAGSEHLFWIAGTTCAIGLAWAATALSREEIDELLKKPEPQKSIAVDADDSAVRIQELDKRYSLQVKQLLDDLAAEKKSAAEFLRLLTGLEKIKHEKEQLEIQIKEAVVWGDPSTKEGRALCRVEGMYQQLRGQYEEKSNQLDRARKELFLLQEEMELLKKQRVEESLYGQPPAEKAMERYLWTLSHTVDRLEHENMCLEELVSKLI